MKISKARSVLKNIISGDVLWDKEILRYYSVDASSYQIFPKIIVIAKNEQDIINLVKFAYKNKISVTVRGAGTGLVGSALNNQIIIDLKKLNSIKILDNLVVVGPGTQKGELDNRLSKKGKFFPPNPSVGAFCSIGGMLGNNSSGSRSLKYGSVIDNVQEVTFVNGKGEKITLPKNEKVGRKILKLSKNIVLEKYPNVTKNSSGYRLDAIKTIDDSHLGIIGSEGTLGIITEAKLKIRNIPNKRLLIIVGYTSLSKAAENCQDILDTDPSAIEFVDKFTIRKIPQKFSNNVKCLLFIEYDSELQSKEKSIEKIIAGKIVIKTSKKSDIKKWWKYRDSALYYSLKSIKIQKRVPHVIEDSAVPIEKLNEFFKLIKKMNLLFHTKSVMYGHAGNGNIHVRLISESIKTKKIKAIAQYYFKEVNKLKGTITAEHGDGLARTEFVKKQYGEKNHQIFKQLKKECDPSGILNPGKIIAKGSRVIKNLEKFE
jgi:glycolate oxidase